MFAEILKLSPEGPEAHHIQYAASLIARGQVDLNARNKDGETALHLAIEKGMKELAALLIKTGARVNARNKNSETPLHAAALHEDPIYAEMLLDAKAYPNLRNDDGETPLHWAVLSEPRRGGRRIDLNQLPFRVLLSWIQQRVESILLPWDALVAQRPMPP